MKKDITITKNTKTLPKSTPMKTASASTNKDKIKLS